MWASLDRFAEHLPTVASAATLGAVLAGGRVCRAYRNTRKSRAILRVTYYSAKASLSGAIGAAMVAGSTVELLPSMPWLVVMSSAAAGVGLDVFRANGLARLQAQWVEYVRRLRDVARP